MKKLLLLTLSLVLAVQYGHAAVAVTSVTTTTAACSVAIENITATVSGSDTAIVATVINHAALATITSVSFNGVFLTLGTSTINPSNNERLGEWYLLNAPVGTFTLQVIASTAAGCIGLGSISLSGVNQTVNPDAASIISNVTTTSFTQTLTTVTNNSLSVWSIMAAGALTLTAGANTSLGSQPDGIFGTATAYATTPKTPAGLVTLNVTSSSQLFAGAMLSFAPSGVAPVSAPSTLGWFRLRKYLLH